MSTLRNAGESVERRGFLDGDQAEAFQDDVLMAQIGRLMEEVGEFARSCREQGPSPAELADIAIVCGAIAHHLGINLDAEVAAKCKQDEAERGYRHSLTHQPELIPGPSKLAMKQCIGWGEPAT
jgi:NTP pyrophosphatase (non-canonical NTP hydrolase)